METAHALTPAISISEVEKTYSPKGAAKIRALGPVSFSVLPHEFVSVVGPSGCGKSTLLKIAAGLIHKSEGSIRINGREVDGPMKDVGMVFQSPVLLPWKNVIENVLLPIQIRHESAQAYRGRAQSLLELVGLQGFEERYPHELSGGMQQRAAIVRALICDPPILFMDEPFGALDAITRDQMNVELLSIWNRTKKTVLFVTHGIAEAVFLSNRVIVLGRRPGQIIEDLTIDIPRPRVIEHMATPAFGEAVTHIRQLLERGSTAAQPQPEPLAWSAAQ
jgi:NitT/TauT family transport system ATP-binding protein